LADRAVELQLAWFSLDRDGVDVMLEAHFAMAGLGMEPLQLDVDVCAWRTEGSGKSVAMAGNATLRADGETLIPERSFSRRWTWRWRSVAGQMVELARLVTVARSDNLVDDPAPVAVDALARSRAIGWRGVLAAHEVAWQERWRATFLRLVLGRSLCSLPVMYIEAVPNRNSPLLSCCVRAIARTARSASVSCSISRPGRPNASKACAVS